MATTKEWFRSAEMEYISIVMQEHSAHRCLSHLGRLGCIQFIDLNPDQTAIQRRYIHEVQRCDEIERKLAFFDQMLEKYQIENNYKYDVNTFLDKLDQRSKESNQGSLLEELESLVDEKEREVQELNNFRTSLNSDFNYQLELKCVLEKSREFTDSRDSQTQKAQNASSRNVEEGGNGLKGENVAVGAGRGVGDGLHFQFLSGTILFEERVRFERMIFRTTRGNCLMRFNEIEEPFEDENGNKILKKVVFIVFYQAMYVEKKIKRICEAFSATLYPVPDFDNAEMFESEYSKVKGELVDRERVLARNKSDIVTILSDLCKWLEVWKWAIAKEKSVYHTMNHFRADIKGVLRAEGWVVSSSKAEVQQLIYDLHASSNQTSSVTSLPSAQWPAMPPTHFATNKFTEAFQLIVDTYGVPRYREANPAVFTVITFPFLFGVMFGDIGHGFLLFFASSLVILKEKELAKMELDEMMKVVYNGRYFLLLMGFFAFYAGLLYNDYFSMGLQFFPVTWKIETEEFKAGDTVRYIKKEDGDVYPLGIDPTWHHADNGLLFFNSLKMKMSVIFGVTQMTMGLFLKLANGIHFKSNVDIFFEAIPQIIFMLSLFGYMCVLIIFKWAQEWGPYCSRTVVTCDPPGLITTLINIALKIGTIEEKALIYENQETTQTALLVIAVIMIPLMLIPKPCILARRLKAEHLHSIDKEMAEPMLNTNNEKDAAAGSQAVAASGEEHSAGDLWIHQAIETIEFCLACISNTASYLRLWALSLAHSQLGSVFLEKALLDQLGNDGPLGVILTFFGYGAFAGISFAVLMVMDNLECFLHALRLHWVEFQSKFYKADGVKFEPLDFQKLLRTLNQKQE